MSDKDTWPEDIRAKYPHYDIESLEARLVQSRQSIKLFKDAIAKEEQKIKDTRDLIRLCYKRDEELAERGII